MQLEKAFNPLSVMDHSQERLTFLFLKPRSPQLFVLGKVTWDGDLQYPVQVSTLTGNVVHLQVLPGALVKDCTRQCMYDDRLSCGTPVLECTPLTTNLSVAKMQASGGKFRLAIFDGEVL